MSLQNFSGFPRKYILNLEPEIIKVILAARFSLAISALASRSGRSWFDSQQDLEFSWNLA